MSTNSSGDVLVIDGSHLEGGGQVLRNAFAYSTLLKKSIRVNNIRSGRTPPGLRPQHAAGLGLVQRISKGSRLEGAEKGSSTVEFHPGEIDFGGSFEADPGTAGSTTLLLQISLPCLLFNPLHTVNTTSVLTLRGGTNATMAPPVDYLLYVLLPFIARHFDLHLKLDVKKRGYFPKGGGEIVVEIPGRSAPLKPLQLLDRGTSVVKIRGQAYVAGALPKHSLGAMSRAVKARLTDAGHDVSIVDIQEIHETGAVGSGSGVFLWAETDSGCCLSGSSIGQKGKDAGKVGEEAANELLANLGHGGCVDEYLQDQLIILMALAKGRSVVSCGPVSLHTRTAIWVAEEMTGAKFNVEPDGDNMLVECEGIGYKSLEAES